MKIREICALGALTASFALTACGGGPDIDQVRADFDNPSGSTKDKTGVMAANGKRDASESALNLATGVPGSAGGLTAAGKFPGIQKVAPRVLWEENLRNLYNRKMAVEGQSLRVAQCQVPGGDAGCANSPEANEAYLKLLQQLGVDAENPLAGGSGNASVSYTQDLGSCSGGDLTGTMEVSLEVTVETGKLSFTIEQEFSSACETEGAQTCIDGSFVMEASLTGTPEGGEGTFEFLTAWVLDATWQENGAQLSASTKGGIRLAGGNGMFAIEFLIYCKDSNGEEVSYVLRYRVNADGSSVLEYKGADGELSCTVTADGNAQCTGSAEMAWTDAEYVGVLSSDDFQD